MAATMNISLPDALKSFVDEQVAAESYGSASEYVRELLRRERDRVRFRTLVHQGFASGPAVAVEDDFFDRLRDSIRGSSAA
jgi:antitoxin ParD1/3/4